MDQIELRIVPRVEDGLSASGYRGRITTNDNRMARRYDSGNPRYFLHIMLLAT